MSALTLMMGASFSSAKHDLFHRSSTFLVCEPNCDSDTETVAETLWYYQDGDSTLIVFTDSEEGELGLVDVTDPSSPQFVGRFGLGGEPTTVRVLGKWGTYYRISVFLWHASLLYPGLIFTHNCFAFSSSLSIAVVSGVNTSPDFVNPSGFLYVADHTNNFWNLQLDLGGQPDAVAVSKPGSGFPMYIAVAIENERDEDLGDGAPPQLPAGEVVIFTIADETAYNDPTQWTLQRVDVTGLENCLYPEDPEPEYVAIDPTNTLVVVTLQENNCMVVIDLQTGAITNHFSAGDVFIEDIDMTEEGVILQEESETLLREPDGASWIGETGYFATANEGDLDGGSRGFSIFEASTGNLIYDSGNEMELETVRVGHYPEERSGNKGNEPENVLYAEAKGKKYLFVCSERSGLVFVYDVEDPTSPILTQTLPVGVGPEGLSFIPHMNVLAVASEKDDRGDKIRSSITLFELKGAETPEYPTIVSAPRIGLEGPYIPFSALSGLASAAPFKMDGFDGADDNILYSIEDSFYRASRFFEIDISEFPAVVTEETRLFDTLSVLAVCLATDFPTDDFTDLFNIDGTVNLDLEGIAVSRDGGFWIVSEGRGTVGSGSRPFEYPNLLLKVAENGVIEECITPGPSFQSQFRFGFEGVAEDGNNVVVAVQRVSLPCAVIGVITSCLESCTSFIDVC